MKVLLLFPENYTLKDIFKIGFIDNGYETINIDFNNFFSDFEKKRNRYLLRLPFKYSKKILYEINNTVNKKYIEEYNNIRPDLVIIYNDQKISKETVRYFKKNSKVVFFLGDNPLFIQNRPDNLSAIIEGDYIFAPDSFWVEQLKIMGINNISYLMPGFNKQLNYTKNVSKEEKNKYGSDIVFIGRQYHDTMGYKRAMFYNNFAGMNFKIYGDAIWNKWFNYFPDLKKHFHLNKTYLPFETVNTILNASKIYPIDANPGIINGLHIRIFDSIASGILPIVEYKKDIDIVFKGSFIPVIKDYKKARGVAKYYINNEKESAEIILNLQKHLYDKYSPKNTIEFILNKVKN